MFTTALRHLALAAALALPLSLLVGPGCGQAHDVCDVVCECTHCSDRGNDDCLIELNRMIDVAAAYDCSEDMDKYVECIVKDNDCDDAVFSANDCVADELTDVLDCMADASDILMSSTGAIPVPSEGEGEGEGELPGTGGNGG